MINIQLPEFLGLLSLDEVVRRESKHLCQSDEILFDASKSVWVSPSSIIFLSCILRAIIDDGRAAKLSIPTHESFAASFLTTVNASHKFDTMGVSSSEIASGISLSGDRMAAFEVFLDRRSSENYLSSLQDVTTFQEYLNTKAPPQIVKAGDFNTILLTELLDNAFTHGSGENAFYSVFESGQSSKGGRKRHPIFADFNGESFIEITVGNSSKQGGIADTLKVSPPNEYRPTYAIDSRLTLNENQRKILYSFEFHATSKPELREKHLENWLNGSGENADDIATGLNTVLSLAKLYSGQLIVQSNGEIANIDFSNSSNELAEVTFFKPRRESNALIDAAVTVTLRAPTKREYHNRILQPASKLRTKPELSKPHATKDSHVFSITIDELKKDPKSTLLKWLKVISENNFNPKLPLISIMIDGLEIDTKIFGNFIIALYRMPTPLVGIAVIVRDKSLVQLAARQWEKLSKHESGPGKLTRHPSILVASDAETYCAFGIQDAPGATTISENLMLLPNGTVCNFSDLINYSRITALKNSLSSSPVLQKDGLYLIEGKYYTKEFYEIRQLASFNFTRNLLVDWVSTQIKQIQPSAITTNVDFFFEIIKEAITLSKHNIPSDCIILVTSESARFEAIQTSIRAGSGRVLCLIDVLCTGRNIKEFASTYPNPENLSIATIVDASESNSGIFPVTASTNTFDLEMVSVLKTKILPIHQRPPGYTLEEIFVIDRVLHHPTRYPVPDIPIVSVDELLTSAESQGAIWTGHFELESKHYTYFFPLRQFIKSLRRQISSWLLSEFGEFLVTPNITSDEVAVFCLDENTTLFSAVEELLRDVTQRKCNLITRDDLFAPRPAVSSGRIYGEVKTAWMILPVTTSGATIQRCLEFANALGATRVHISIMLGRVTDRDLNFYQGISKYKGIEVLIKFFISLPLVAYDRGNCPVCRMAEEHRNRKDRIKHDWPELKAILDQRELQLEPVRISAAAIEHTQKTDHNIAKEIFVRSTYERARRDPNARQLLKTLLEDPSGVDALFASIGRAPSDSAFFEDDFKVRVYDESAIIKAFDSWASGERFASANSGLLIRGFAKIYPELVSQKLEELHALNLIDSELLSDISYYSIFSPQIYWEFIENVELKPEETQKDLFISLRHYIIQGSGASGLVGLRALDKIYWHITRSAGWERSWDNLEECIGDQNPSQLRVCFENFKRDGVDRLRKLVEIAARCIDFWRPVSDELSNFHKLVREIETQCEEISFSIGLTEPDFNELINILKAIASSKVALVHEIDRFGVQPSIGFNDFSKMEMAKRFGPETYNFNTSGKCPSLAIAKVHFYDIVVRLLENAEKHKSRINKANHTTFYFEVIDQDFQRISMKVFQDQPWKESTKRDGGLIHIHDVLENYGGTIRTLRENKDGAILQILFNAWPLPKKFSEGVQ